MKKINYLKILFYFMSFIVMVPFHLLAEPVSSPDNKGSFPVVERDTVHDMVREYETELESLNNELLNLKRDREWLYLKISSIQDQNRFPPQVLIESRINLTQKIVAAQKRKNRLLEFIQTHKGSIDQLNRQIENNGASGFFALPETSNNTSHGLTAAGLETELKKKISQAGLENQVEVERNPSGLVMRTVFPILFDSCKYTITGEYKKFLGQLADLLKPYEVFINVEGFTDYIKIKGNQMTNIELSAKRAGAVVRELENFGMKSSIFKITGNGEYKKCLEKSNRCRVLSRRADIIIHFNNG